jgi:hypothetical protein
MFSTTINGSTGNLDAKGIILAIGSSIIFIPLKSAKRAYSLNKY